MADGRAKAMKKTILMMALLLFSAPAWASDAPQHDKLRQRQGELELRIEEHENMINDQNLMFVRYATLLRPVPLGEFVDYLLEMKQRGEPPEAIAKFVSLAVRQTAEYRKTVREQVLPDLWRELRQVREGLRSSALTGERHEGSGFGNPEDDPAAEEGVPWHIVSEADRIISGHWILTLNGKESIIYVTLEEKAKGVFTGILTLDRLQYFEEGDLVFRVSPQPWNAAVFEGTEFGYDAVGGKREAELRLDVQAGEMTYHNGEQALKLYKR